MAFGVVFLILLGLAVFAYTSLEIYPVTVYKSPSRQVLVNDFFALEQWLAKTGHPVRRLKRGNAARIVSAPEKTVYVQADVFDWEGAAEPLKAWMEAGGFLFVSVEPYADEDEDFHAFLESFGISAGWSEKDPETDESSEDSGYEEAEGKNIEPFSEDSGYEETADESMEPLPGDSPDFYYLIQFELSEAAGASAFTLVEQKFGKPLVRLVQIPLGAGALTCTGPPQFMENDYLDREVNARLAWDLTGARAGEENPGLLFIRGKAQVKSLFGKLADRGNFLPLGVSVLVLLFVGFWMVIPPFGLVFPEQTGPGRPIRDRFRAEIRFLKKYGALETYLELYLEEIKRKLRGREPAPEMEAIEQALREKGRLPRREIIRSLQILKTIMESL
jgi:hypothetical protein